MKVIRVFLLFIFITITSSDYASLKATEADIKIYLFTQQDLLHGTRLNISDKDEVDASAFSKDKDTVFYIHGWMDNNSSETLISTKDTYLSKYDVNMFLVDWGTFADNIIYNIAYDNVEAIGDIVGYAIEHLVQNTGVDLNRITIVGHSLGAHVAGVAGRILSGKLDHIVGLDPAGPLFTKENTKNRLTPESAQFVHVIHTCGGLLGYFDRIGDADYYPNGGKSQPGCILDVVGRCSHLLSIQYYLESVLTGNFKSRKCGSYDEFNSGMCNNSTISYMGQYNVDKEALGTYFLQTNIQSPYARN
ncbi:pancreatic lipase-related protein 2-like [Diabrotica undecimpunctata]|uniref:pancreatic lipase-related protein 2-like n=1 Tax=Diabrotica undecimpunctata TaxID=50387 RepID=UPI003B6372A0